MSGCGGRSRPRRTTKKAFRHTSKSGPPYFVVSKAPQLQAASVRRGGHFLVNGLMVRRAAASVSMPLSTPRWARNAAAKRIPQRSVVVLSKSRAERSDHEEHQLRLVH